MRAVCGQYAATADPTRARARGLGLGGTDASVAVLADTLGTKLIVTLDRRHFGAIRSEDGRPYELIPA